MLVWIFNWNAPFFFFADIRDEVLDLKFSPDGTRLATCSRDMSILIYAIEDIAEARQHHHDSKEGAEEHDGGEGDTHGKLRASAGSSVLPSTVRVAREQSADGGGNGNGSSGGCGSGSDSDGDNQFDGTHQDGAKVLHPLRYGRLRVRLIHRLRRSATASVCRIFW